jgi:hypothetical protein
MAKKLTALNQLRPRIVSQNMVDLEEMARRISKNTTYNPQEVSSILQLFAHVPSAASILKSLGADTHLRKM